MDQLLQVASNAIVYTPGLCSSTATSSRIFITHVDNSSKLVRSLASRNWYIGQASILGLPAKALPSRLQDGPSRERNHLEIWLDLRSLPMKELPQSQQMVRALKLPRLVARSRSGRRMDCICTITNISAELPMKVIIGNCQLIHQRLMPEGYDDRPRPYRQSSRQCPMTTRHHHEHS